MKKHKHLLILILGYCVLLILNIIHYPTFKEGNNKTEEIYQLMKKQKSPFNCSNCNYVFSDYDINNLRGGAVKGTCPNCRAKILDKLLVSKQYDMDLVHYSKSVFEKYRQTADGTPAWFALFYLNLIIVIGWTFLIRYLESRNKNEIEEKGK